MSMHLIEGLAAMATRARSIAAGQYVFHRGDPVTRLFIVAEGRIDLVRHSEVGGVITLQRAGAGSILAEASMFSDRYHCDGVATVQSCTRSISKPAMRSRLAKDPEFAEAWAAFLAHEVQAMRGRAEILSLKTVAERLDAWIASNDGLFPAKGEWKAIAAEIGVSPEALYRELAKRRNS